MKQFSKVLLLSAVSLFVDSGNVTYASFEDASSPLKSGIPTLHTHHTYLRHTQEILNLSSHLFDKGTDKGVKIASVCFITDAGNCSGNDFGNTDSPNGGGGGGGNPDDHGTPEELCEEAGYTQTGNCPSLQTPNEKCPYDSSYYDKCVCSSSLVSCPSPKVGVGNSCDGKYQSCCTPLSDESNCQYGTTTSSDGCGGTRTVCKACTPLTNETNCQYGTVLGSDGCGGTRNVCKDCMPLSDETNCQYGIVLGSDGCGGTRTVCKECDNTCPPGYSITKPDIVIEESANGCGDKCYRGLSNGSSSGSGGECEKVCITYQTSVSFECRSMASSYQLCKIYHDFNLQNDGSYKEDTSGSAVTIYHGKYNTLTACQNEANNRKNELGDKYCVASECK